MAKTVLPMRRLPQPRLYRAATGCDRGLLARRMAPVECERYRAPVVAAIFNRYCNSTVKREETAYCSNATREVEQRDGSQLRTRDDRSWSMGRSAQLLGGIEFGILNHRAIRPGDHRWWSA